MKSTKKVKVILIIVFILLVSLIGIMFFLWYQKVKDVSDISDIYNNYEENSIQNRLLEDANTENIENTSTTLMESKNGEDVLGVIKIDAIDYEGLVYEGTSLNTLAKGVGHFESSSYYEGNVCLAAHNTINQWSKLHTVKVGNKIIYTSFLGTKTYEISTVKQIEETDWSMLQETEDNRITLITCVKGVPSKRLCVQGLEIK